MLAACFRGKRRPRGHLYADIATRIRGDNVRGRRSQPTRRTHRSLIDAHNRGAHVGIALRHSFRGRGFSSHVLQLLCRYGFEIRGLHRPQLETPPTTDR